ncbi:DUF5684 domain-containing protein [Microbacterium sp. BR1]|uniref:DUF5684 domain-containing protein n=1 Tax=Microbacterium sp. BR1 TaxID=1070896 RepID=UPI000C2B9B29|nr:DUF5684 domain-containing protein [Microbacterium sp. BR1]
MNTTELITTSLVVALVLYLWVALGLSAVFRKAGEHPWQAWVPILNTVVFLRLGGLSPWLVLLAFVPVVGTLAFFVVAIIALQRINRSFGLGVGMTVLGALLFPVWASIVGWGSARWLPGSAAIAPARRSVGADAGWGTPDPSPRTPSATPADGAVLGSVFGAHGPAGGPELPPRPAPPTIDGYPSVVPVPVGRGGVPLRSADSAREAPTLPPVPTFRSTMQETPAAFATGDGAGEPSGVPARAFLHATPPRRSAPGTHGASADDLGVPGSRPSFTPEDMDDTEGARPQAEPPVSARPSTEPWGPAASAAVRPAAFQPFLGSSELTYESSAEVSAVQGAPTSGAPRSARTSVSAQHRRPEIPDNEALDESFDETIVAVRRRTVWTLVPTLGAPIPLTADVVIIGRRPHREPDYGDAQLVAIPDETRTVSKTHARMELTADGWTIVDLDSTNGVILIGEDGAEKDAPAGCPERLTPRFLLGDAEFGLRREGE